MKNIIILLLSSFLYTIALAQPPEANPIQIEKQTAPAPKPKTKTTTKPKSPAPKPTSPAQDDDGILKIPKSNTLAKPTTPTPTTKTTTTTPTTTTNWITMYDYVDKFIQGFARVNDGLKWGVVSLNGDIIIPIIYDNVDHYKDSIFLVTLNKLRGAIDIKNNIIIPIYYNEIVDFKDGFLAVIKDGKSGCIDYKGNVIIPLIYSDDLFVHFVNDMAEVKLNNKIFYINKKGKCVKDCPETSNNGKNDINGIIDKKIFNWREKYDEIGVFVDGLARVKVNGKWAGFVNTNGDIVIPLKYEIVYDYSENLACVKLNGKKGFIDKNGNVIIPIVYDNAFPFSEGLANVELNKKWGYINKHNNVIIDLKYDFAEQFKDGMAKVQSDKAIVLDVKDYRIPPVVLPPKKIYINKKGECVKDCP